jgi:hypothetical protein
MDGTVAGNKVNGVLVRPATLDRALELYPQLILLMTRIQLQQPRLLPITTTLLASGREVFIIKDPAKVEVNYYLLSEDFEKCKSIALSLLPLPLFPSEPDQSLLATIRSKIKIAFAV